MSTGIEDGKRREGPGRCYKSGSAALGLATVPQPAHAARLPTGDTTLSDPVPGAGEVREAGSAPPSDDAEARPQESRRKGRRSRGLRRQRLTLLMQSIDAQPPDFATSKGLDGGDAVSPGEIPHAALTDLTHNDPTMLSKLLRLVNAAYYSAVGGDRSPACTAPCT